MLYQVHPIKARNIKQLRDDLIDLQKNPIKCPSEPEVPEEIRKVVEWMLRFNEEDRISWELLL